MYWVTARSQEHKTIFAMFPLAITIPAMLTMVNLIQGASQRAVICYPLHYTINRMLMLHLI